MTAVVALVCSAALGALELARENGLSPPEGVKVVEVPCSGRVDEVTILRTLRQGAHAVLVVGCIPGNCRFHGGNLEARREVEKAQDILRQIGLAPERVEMVSVASIQYARLMDALADMASRAERLGPVRLTEGDE